LPAFPGIRAVADALELGAKVTGSTVHFVDAGVDTGPIIAQEAVVVEPEDDEETLHERIKAVERRLLVDVIAKLARAGRSEEHTSELQSRENLVCRLLLVKKKHPPSSERCSALETQ